MVMRENARRVGKRGFMIKKIILNSKFYDTWHNIRLKHDQSTVN